MKQTVTLYRCLKRGTSIGSGMCCLECKDKTPDYINKKPCKYEKKQVLTPERSNYHITRDDLVPYIKKAYQEMLDWLRVQHNKLGGRYDWTNDYETIGRKFCRGSEYPDKWAEEFLLIVNKSSKLPSSQRTVIQKVGIRALDLYLMDISPKKK